MGKSLITNPPYNMKWQLPAFAQTQERFTDYELPPESNSNYAFILTALNWIDDKAVLLLPNGVLSTNNAQEKIIREQLIKSDLLDAVITLPDNMFVSTTIGTCILLFNKHKKFDTVEMIDLRQSYKEEQRDQNGQFGGSSHEKRTYHKTFKIVTEEVMNKAIECINERKDIPEFSKSVTLQDLEKEDYIVIPSRYIKLKEREERHRPYSDIVKNLNDIVGLRNSCKLVINETLAKQLGFDVDIYKTAVRKSKENKKNIEQLTGEKMLIDDYITFTKNKNEICFKSNGKDMLSHLFRFFLMRWQQDLDLLNDLETVYLAELRDALLPDLMSGKIDVSSINL